MTISSLTHVSATFCQTTHSSNSPSFDTFFDSLLNQAGAAAAPKTTPAAAAETAPSAGKGAKGFTHVERFFYREVMVAAWNGESVQDPKALLDKANQMTADRPPWLKGIISKESFSCGRMISPHDVLQGIMGAPEQPPYLDFGGFSRGGGDSCSRFPSKHAPQGVQMAWQETVRRVSFAQKDVSQSPFTSYVITRNVQYSAQGWMTGVLGPEDEGFVDPYAEADFPYREHVQELLDLIGSFSEEPEAEEATSFLEAFLESLDSLESRGGGDYLVNPVKPKKPG